jgi:hypothetical protein
VGHVHEGSNSGFSRLRKRSVFLGVAPCIFVVVRQQYSGYIFLITNFNSEDGGSTAFETSVSNQQTTGRNIQKTTTSIYEGSLLIL